jgi:hypothetical protein
MRGTDMVEPIAPTKLTDAYWSGRLSEHLRWVLRDPEDTSCAKAAAAGLAEYNEWVAAQRERRSPAPRDGAEEA